ncbi:YadA C-terminal domain-containing protein [Vibrio lentus]|uniref:YadA C-terminal domain-containing protein n=1 Tax=Vibrio lentus TaxID=136468 RepID=UPI001D045807|nr:YadA C-terminal domain-containing protein [Vibrio lentus]MCB5357812.1 hypothetical protein [Vibrio lentus]MCC5571391.1 hypothetical protein [Vibrio lentus]
MKKSLLALTLSSLLVPLSNASQDLTPNFDVSGDHLKTINEVMGTISKSDMQSYKALFMMADSRDDKAMVVKMMIVNETSTSNILSYLAKNEAFTNAYPELFDGTDFQGNPKPTQEFEDLVNGKRNAQWNKEVANFYSDLEGHISSLEGDDLQKAINLLDSISIQGRTSLLETMQNNGYLADAESDETYSDEVIEEKLREKNTEGDINPPLWESPKDGSAAKKAKEIIGSVSRGDMDGYKAIYALAETKEQKKAVLGMMIANETSASDITKFLADNEDFVAEFGEEFFELDENGNVVKDKLGNPKLILDEDGNSPLETIIGDKRNAQWSDKVGGFYSDLEEKISGLSDEDKQSALNLLDSITIDGRNSLLDKMNGNGYLKDVTDENGNIIVPIADPNLQDELIGDKEKELRDRHEVKDIDSGKKFVDEINKVTEDSEEAQQFVDDYISAEDEQKQEQASEVVSKATAEQIALMKTFTFTIPASESSSQTETNLWDYLNGVANGDIDPEVAPIDTENFSYTDADVAKLTVEAKGMKAALTEQFATIKQDQTTSKQALVDHLGGLEGNARTELQGAKGKLQFASMNMQEELSDSFAYMKTLTEQNGAEIYALNEKVDSGKVELELAAEYATNMLTRELTQVNADIEASQAAQDALVVDLNIAEARMTVGVDSLKNAASNAEQQLSTTVSNLESRIKDLESNDVGTNPPNEGGKYPMDHEFGSVGQGQAVAHIEKKVEGAKEAAESEMKDHLGGLEGNARTELQGAKGKLQFASMNMQEELSDSFAYMKTLTEQNGAEIYALNEKVDSGKVELELAAEYATNMLTRELTQVNADIEASQAAQDALVVDLNIAEARMTVGVDSLKNAASNAEQQLSTTVSNLESRIKDLESNDVGTNPPNEGGKYPMDHEFGSVGQGQAVAHIEKKVEGAKEAAESEMKDHLGGLEGNARVELHGAKGNLQNAMQVMMAQMQSMQAEIDRLKSGQDQIPENGGVSNTDLIVGLEKAGQILNNKMQTAKSVMQDARKEWASSRNSDVGINPPMNVAPSTPKAPDVVLPPQDGEPNDHELGSTGEGQAVAYVQSQADTATYAMEANIEALEGQIAGINSRIDDVYEDLDSTMATAQAVTAARPYIGYGHTSAFGVGLGGAGEQSAIAVGYAHKVTENWTLNGNVSGTKGNDVNVSAGVGASYSW